jgi:hypothetical protein
MTVRHAECMCDVCVCHHIGCGHLKGTDCGLDRGCAAAGALRGFKRETQRKENKRWRKSQRKDGRGPFALGNSQSQEV